MPTQRKDGRWVDRKRTPQGRIVGYGATPEEATADLERKLNPTLSTSTPLPPEQVITVHDAAKALWYPSLAHLGSSSRARYESAYRLHIRGTIGQRELTTVRPADVQAWVSSLIGKPIKPNGKGKATRPMEANGVRFVAGILSQVMRAARRNGFITANPCDDVKLPKKPAKRQRYLSIEDASALVASMRGTPLAAPAFFMVFLGLRRGEVCGLKWDDLDRQTRTLHVHRQRKRMEGGRHSDEALKTESSDRYLRLTAGMVEQIDSLGDLDSAYICTDGGRPWKPNEMTRLWDRHLCPESLGGTTFIEVERETRRPGAWTLHDLRHVAAGIIHELTQSPEAVRIILGHASTDMTLGYIAEASAKTGETLKLLDEAMRPKR